MNIDELQQLIKEQEEEIKKITADTEALDKAYANKEVSEEEYQKYKTQNDTFIVDAQSKIDNAKQSINELSNINTNKETIDVSQIVGSIKDKIVAMNAANYFLDDSEKIDLKPFEQAIATQDIEDITKAVEAAKILKEKNVGHSDILYDKLNELLEVKISEKENEANNDVEEAKANVTQEPEVAEVKEPQVEAEPVIKSTRPIVSDDERIFTDEERIDKDHTYLSAANVYNLGYLNTDELENDSLAKPTLINRFTKIKEKLWKKIENFRNRKKNVPQLDEDEVESDIEPVKEPIVEEPIIDEDLDMDNGIDIKFDDEDILPESMEVPFDDDKEANAGIDIKFDDAEQVEPVKSDVTIDPNEITGYTAGPTYTLDEKGQIADQIINDMINNPQEDPPKGMGRSGFISVSIMAITTTVVSLAIFALGLIIIMN